MNKHTLAAALALTLASTNCDAAAVIPPAIGQRLAAGEFVDLLVQFDDTDVQQDAERERARLGVEFDTPQMTDWKAARFAEIKESVRAATRSADVEVLLDYSHLPMQFMRFHTADALRRWADDARITGLFEDHPVRPTQSTPWNLVRIGQPATAASGMTGAGTAVAILDTGTDYTSPAFGSCTAPGVPAGCRVVRYQSFCGSSGQLDWHGHGTNVAGISAYVAPQTRIIALKVIDSGCNSSHSINAANWVIANRATYNIVAMNLSFCAVSGSGDDPPCIKYTSPCSDNAWATPIANAKSVGILTAAAAGNDAYTDGIGSPACAPAAVSVGATNSSDNVANFSNSANFLTMLAPGVGIIAGGIPEPYNGTSMAAPHVAGAAAVLRAAYPTESINRIKERMTIYGQPITDARNGIVKSRLDLWEASRPLPAAPTFAPPITRSVGQGPWDIVAADFNADGWSDLAVSNLSSDSISLLLNDSGSPSLASTTMVGAGPHGLAAGDFNRDGRLDVAAASTTTNSVTALLGNGMGGFPGQSSSATGGSPRRTQSADLNGDGILDLVTSNLSANSVSVLLGNPNGTFQSQVSYTTGNRPDGIAVGDFNQDGIIDVVTANSSSVSIFLGIGNGMLQLPVAISVGSDSRDIVVDDINGDGVLDLLVASTSSNTLLVLPGTGSTTFGPAKSYPVGSTPAGVAVADINGDGFKDLLVTNKGGNTLGILLGNRVGSFHSQIAVSTLTSPTGIAIADINRDGRPDIALTGSGSNAIAIFLNTTTPYGGPLFADGFDGP